MDTVIKMKTPTKAKLWYRRNKTRILGTALVATTTYAILINRNKRQFDHFLAEEGLLDKYYAPEYYEEMHS